MISATFIRSALGLEREIMTILEAVKVARIASKFNNQNAQERLNSFLYEYENLNSEQILFLFQLSSGKLVDYTLGGEMAAFEDLISAKC